LKPGFLADLVRRTATAAVALPLLALALFWGHPLLLVTIVGAAVVVGLFEFYALIEKKMLQPYRVLGFILLAAFFFDVHGLTAISLPLGPFVAMATLLALLARKGDFSERVAPAAATLLGAAYLGALGGSLSALRTLPPDNEGPWRVVLLLATMMMADTAAYFVGSAVGRHKLAPSISPGKTVEGGVGALAGGVLTAILVAHCGLPTVPWPHAALLGALVTVFGTLGDLAESLLKRWAGVKDSGALFPGHGGMLDRLDSLLFGAPVLYYYFLLR
jgi:phosphatidate cytidylyltransferase